jgi:hypothetical protein
VNQPAVVRKIDQIESEMTAEWRAEQRERARNQGFPDTIAPAQHEPARRWPDPPRRTWWRFGRWW